MHVPPYAYLLPELVHSPRMQDYCTCEYHNHKKGCPNYDKADRCPPRCGYITDFIDQAKPMYFVHTEFDLEAQERMMLEKHPGWTRPQARCVLYWQGKIRKQLKERAFGFASDIGADYVDFVPEGRGVNVYVTARKAGLVLERIRDIKIVKHVALVGWKKEAKR